MKCCRSVLILFSDSIASDHLFIVFLKSCHILTCLRKFAFLKERFTNETIPFIRPEGFQNEVCVNLSKSA